MAFILQQEVDVPGWASWSDSHILISRELRGVDRASLKVYFEALHGLTEAVWLTNTIGLAILYISSPITDSNSLAKM